LEGITTPIILNLVNKKIKEVILWQIGNAVTVVMHWKRMRRLISARPVSKNANLWTPPVIPRIVPPKELTKE
jgi:hypothetical protein